MKKVFVISLSVLFLVGCGTFIDTAKKMDANMADYLGVPVLSLDCRAGIAQADLDISTGSVPVSRVKAITKYGNPNSEDYKNCYAKISWLSYLSKKIEGAVKSWVAKLIEIGIME
jgi:hypothetical protein